MFSIALRLRVRMNPSYRTHYVHLSLVFTDICVRRSIRLIFAVVLRLSSLLLVLLWFVINFFLLHNFSDDDDDDDDDYDNETTIIRSNIKCFATFL